MFNPNCLLTSSWATPQVSSPPTAISASRLFFSIDLMMRSGPRSILKAIGTRRSQDRAASLYQSACRIQGDGHGHVFNGPRQPSRKPITSDPESLMLCLTTALITAFKPGQSPPPVRMPIRIFCFLPLSNIGTAEPPAPCGTHAKRFDHSAGMPARYF